MKSRTLSSFWDAYDSLDEAKKRNAQKAFFLWTENPYHPSLHFKCVNHEGNIWSVRISRGYRALGHFAGDTVTWYWIGTHDEYLRRIPTL